MNAFGTPHTVTNAPVGVRWAAMAALMLTAASSGACKSKTVATAPGENAQAASPLAPGGREAQPTEKAPLRRAQASIAPVGDHKVAGTLIFSELPDGAGVHVEGALVGLTPGSHGMHVHETPDCSSADGMSAGGHFNPTQAAHGDVAVAASHMGDLGNVVADATGRATVDVVKPGAALGTAPSSLTNHSLVVHAGPDDLKSQPAGDSGGRVACGIINPI